MNEEERQIEFTEAEMGAMLYLIGMEIARLRAIEDSESSTESVGSSEINFYKNLAFKINGTN